MFLFIKKSARKHEGKENMKPVFGQRGENVVGPLSTPLQLSGRRIKHYLWEELSKVLSKNAVIVPK